MPDRSHRPPRLTVVDRAGAWLVTGPIGRVAAFIADLAVYWWRWVAGRQVDDRNR